MRAGQLRHRVIIQANTISTNSFGAASDSWATDKTVWAAIWPMSVKELTSGARNDMLVTHRIRIRYQTGITAAQRVLYGSRVFNITGIININERDETIDFTAVEEPA